MTKHELLEQHIILYNNNDDYIKANLNIGNYVLLYSSIYGLCVVFSGFHEGLPDNFVIHVNSLYDLEPTDISTSGISLKDIQCWGLTYINASTYQSVPIPSLYYYCLKDNKIWSVGVNYVYIKKL